MGVRYRALMTVAEPYFRPIPCDLARPGARPLAGGPLGVAEIEVLARGHNPEILPLAAIPSLYAEGATAVDRITARRPRLLGLDLGATAIMGVLNVTPDSFSDGGRLDGPEAAIEAGLAMAEAGADIIDIGGESTRPGAEPVPEAEEAARVLPVIEGLMAAGCPAPISIDTRKATVAEAALAAGARLFNDVSALSHDPASLKAAGKAEAVCLMHAQGDPRTMQENPRYDDVVLDVYDFLAARVAQAEAAGIPRTRLIVDPGIGFGKTLAHNLALLHRLSIFHALGCPVLLGASRKRFIGRLSGVEPAEARLAGSLAAALAGADEGAQILRVHDVAETRQALSVWRAIRMGGAP